MVVPLRDERDDLRAAINTMFMVQSNTKPMSDETLKFIHRKLTTYCDPKPDRILSPAETKSLLRG